MTYARAEDATALLIRVYTFLARCFALTFDHQPTKEAICDPIRSALHSITRKSAPARIQSYLPQSALWHINAGRAFSFPLAHRSTDRPTRLLVRGLLFTFALWLAQILGG